MFVEVPIRVQTPPNIEAKESGISSFEGLIPASRANPRTIGRKMATAAVLLMKAETRPTGAMRETSVGRRPRRPTLVSRLPRRLTAPVWTRPALSTNMAATVTVAVLLKPEMACSGVRIPLTRSVDSTRSATRSTGRRSVAKQATAPAATAITSTISRVIGGAVFSRKRTAEVPDADAS